MGLTIGDMLFKPGQVCQGIGRGHRLGKPLSFYVTISFLLGVLVVALLAVLLAFLPAILANIPQSEGVDLNQILGLGAAMWIGMGAAILVAVVVGAIVWAFVASAVYHVILAIFGAAKEGFAATFAVTCYAFGSTAILMLIPCVGSIIQLIWLIFALALGYAAAHKTDVWRTACSTVLVFLLCCGLNVIPSLVTPGLSEAIEKAQQEQVERLNQE